MKKLSVILLLFLSSSLFAQINIPIQLDIGLNQSWFIYEVAVLNDLHADFRPKLNLSVNYNFAEFNNFIPSAGIRYYNLGRSISQYNSKAKIDLYFISVPLQLKYRLGIINTNILVNAETSFLLKGNTELTNTGIINSTEKNNITAEMNRLLFSIGIGIEYNLNIVGQTFGLKSIYNFGLTKIPKDGIYQNASGLEYQWAGFKANELSVALTYYL